MKDEPMPRSDPESRGVPSAAILTFLDAAEARIDALHSFVLARHGHVVADGWWHPHLADRPHMLFSVTKSFTSTAVGLAVAEGRLSVDDPVLSFFPDAAPPVVDRHLAAMRVRHLLTMTTGHAADPSDRFDERADGDWVAAFLALPVEYEPGSRFVYNSGASHLLSAIVARSTGATLLDYLRPRLFEPLGITDPTWERDPLGSNTGGWGLNLRTSELARFGQLYLDRGVWNGRQLLSPDWIRTATGALVDNDIDSPSVDSRQGYGYQFWRCRYGVYRADGAFGQLCLVMPEQDAVLAMTGGVADMQAVLDLVWTHLLPAMEPGPLPSDDATRQRLHERLAALRLPPVRGRTSSIASRVSGRTYVVAKPPEPVERFLPPVHGDAPTIGAITFTARPDGWTVTLQDARGTHEVVCGDGEWRTGTMNLGRDHPAPIAASAAWTDDDTLVVRVCLLETPYIRTFTCHFEGTEVTVTARDNVSFGPTDHPPIRAHHRPA